jgi:hypothetical protein
MYSEKFLNQMNVSRFIGLFSAVLLTWLGFTFFHEVPQERRSKQERFSSETAKSPLLRNTEKTTASFNE